MNRTDGANQTATQRNTPANFWPGLRCFFRLPLPCDGCRSEWDLPGLQVELDFHYCSLDTSFEMLRILGSTSSFRRDCDRREVMRIGALGAAGLALPELLFLESATASVGMVVVLNWFEELKARVR